jgi:membrane-associated phospholipid phosphatase
MPAVLLTLTVIAALAIGAYSLASLLDRTVLLVLDWPNAEREDWHRALRIVGYLPTWIVAGAIVALAARPRADFSRAPSLFALGVYVIASPLLSGLIAEPVKLLFRRLRPDPDQSGYAYRVLSADHPWWSTAGLGLPSSHAAVAFAGATALCLIAPRAALLWLLLAAGCAFTRLADRAHWLSDVTLGGILGAAVALLLARLLRVRSARRPEAV